MEAGKNLRGGSEIGSANRVATTAGVNVRSGDGGHESCFCYVAVFDGPSLTDDDSTFLTVEFAPEDGLPLGAFKVEVLRNLAPVELPVLVV